MKKLAIITGSSGGIGSSLVNEFHSSGYDIIGIDIKNNKKNLEKITFAKIDLINFSTDEKYRQSSIDDLKKLIQKPLSNIVIINNAALQIQKEFKKISWSDLHDSIAVNSTSPFFLIQGLFSELKEAKGHVINISSIHSKLTKNGFLSYAASKSALESITRSLSIELAKFGISVNAIAPAAVDTSMLRSGFKDNLNKLKELKDYHPTATIGSPDELAKFIKIICDNKDSFLNGSIIDYNGAIGSQLHDPS